MRGNIDSILVYMTATHELIHSGEISDHDRQLIQEELLDYFFSDPRKADERARYEATGIIPTNNLYLYFLDQPDDRDESPARAYDYKLRPFGEVFEAFKENDPALWKLANQVASSSRQLTEEQLRLLHEGSIAEARAYQAAITVGEGVRAAVFSYVLERLAPDLQARGFKPIDVCT